LRCCLLVALRLVAPVRYLLANQQRYTRRNGQ
jgi:hypothetical protein